MTRATDVPSLAMALFGTDQPADPSRVLSAGPYSFILERGQVRAFRRDAEELIRGVGLVVRDRDWDTLPLVPENLEIEAEPDHVVVRYRASVPCQGAELAVTARLELDRTGRLRFEARAVAHGHFHTNRTGFVVLYPLRTAAGAELVVEHSDGSIEHTRLPRLVAPGQPVFDIRCLRHEPLPGLAMTCRLEGEVFEMEDHRNWTDASFKIYSRPLAWQRPYLIASGTEVRQAVDLTFTGRPTLAGGPPDDGVVRLTVGEADGTVPEFGIAARPEDCRLPDAVIARYADLPLHPLLCAVGRLAGPAAVRDHAALLRRLDRPRTLAFEAVVSGDDPESDLQDLAEAARREGLAPAAVSVFMEPYLRSYQPADVRPATAGFERLHAAARATFPEALIGGGMYSFFTELNRQRDAARGADYITHTSSALVHDCDDRSVMQTLEALPDVFTTTRDFAGALRYRVGPVALGLRHNPGGAPVPPNPEQRRKVLTDDDPRWRGLFGASWMVGYAAEAAKAGLDAVTFGALGGPWALVSLGRGQPLVEGAPFPTLQVFSVLAGASGRPLAPLVSSRPEVRGLAWQGPEGGRQALVANNTTETILLAREIGGSAPSVEVLAADWIGRAQRNRPAWTPSEDDVIRLGPYGIAFLAE